MVSIPREVREVIIEDVKKSYPHEGCGILVGKGKEVKGAYSTRNMVKDRAHDRYEIDPKEFIEIDKRASESGLDIVGFYHSHPDHPPLPSQFDRERAWSDYIYLILSVSKDGRVEERAWIFDGDRFIEEDIEE